MTIKEMAENLVTLADEADDLVALVVAKANAIQAAETALRKEIGGGNFPLDGQGGLANYINTLVDRLRAGETRANLIEGVGAKATRAWGVYL